MFGLLLSVAFQPAKPLAGELRRGEQTTERAAVRQVASTVIKAARHLVGSDTHKPAMTLGSAAVARLADRVESRGGVETESAPAVEPLRAELLDLPPPPGAQA